jgi:hypothetical protein
MLKLSHTLSMLPHLTGRVNTAQLVQVETDFLPPHVVRLAPEPELVRVAHEVADERPELADEAQFVVRKELHRRACKMSVSA